MKLKALMSTAVAALALAATAIPANAIVYRVPIDVSAGHMNIRSGPGVNHSLLGEIPAGATVAATRCAPRDDGVAGGDWCLVTYNGVTGWASTAGLMPIAPPRVPVAVTSMTYNLRCIPTPERGDRNPPVVTFVDVDTVGDQVARINVYYDLLNGERVYRSRQYNAVAGTTDDGSYGWKGTYVRDPRKTMAGAVTFSDNGQWTYREKQWDRGVVQYDYTMPCNLIAD